MESAESRAHCTYSPESADEGNGSVLWPVGLNFQGDKARHTDRTVLWEPHGVYHLQFWRRGRALSSVAGRKV